MTRPVAAEGVGSALLLYVVAGSGIAAERLGNDASAQLMAHGVAVGPGLAGVIALSVAHFLFPETARQPSLN